MGQSGFQQQIYCFGHRLCKRNLLQCTRVVKLQNFRTKNMKMRQSGFRLNIKSNLYMYWHCMISSQLQKCTTYLHSAFAVSACFCYVYIGFQRSPLLCLTKNELLTFQFIENHSCAKSNIKLVFDTYKSVRNRLFVYINDGRTPQVTKLNMTKKSINEVVPF